MGMRRLFALLAPLAALVAASPALALDYRSVIEAAPLYDAPSAKSTPLFVVLAGTPVELVVSLEGWSKVRDSKGDLAWIEKSHLTEKRNVIVRAERAQVRAAADDKAALVFEAERDVVLELSEAAPGGWARVKHRDGPGGFLKTTQVWGL
jgi:SH3-like domain-containing protein